MLPRTHEWRSPSTLIGSPTKYLLGRSPSVLFRSVNRRGMRWTSTGPTCVSPLPRNRSDAIRNRRHDKEGKSDEQEESSALREAAARRAPSCAEGAWAL